MTKKLLSVILFCFVTVAPSFAQKFTKREQARREARENYYFCGNMFTFTAGYNHSWLTPSAVTLKSDVYGKSEKICNTKDAFNIGFLWDYAFKKYNRWSIQTGLYYTVKGGEHLYYYDNGLGAGPQLKEENTVKLKNHGIELQCLLRRSFLIAYDQRVTLNVGPYITRLIDTPSEIKGWDLGALVGVGYDYKHLSASVTYQPGVFAHIADQCNTRQANISLNVGFRFWKK